MNLKPTADVKIDPENVRCIQSRLKSTRPADSVERFYANCAHTKDFGAHLGNPTRP